MINYSNFEIIMIILTFVIYSLTHVFSIFTIPHQTIIYDNYLAFLFVINSASSISFSSSIWSLSSYKMDNVHGCCYTISK